ncbi:MAG: TlyA family rRNA (cytidine-2'-O)-methyltransferase [Phycisphaerales bacterium]|nr:TlyA family rRNA (cytidine-2'-O)-methyltransferase [Phycisphaerales bacterium]
MSEDCPYVSRGGLKLKHALDTFRIDVTGLTCADFGCSTGGFTDCLLQSGAASVHAVDTAYGQLAWKLRQDPRVHVMERTNILHAEPPGPVELVVADAGWTPQRLLIPAALRWLGPAGRIISLVKPHYEVKELGEALPRGGVLEEEAAERIAQRTAERLPELGVRVLGLTRSPIRGGATSGGAKKKGAGNPEWLVLLERAG